MAVSHVAAAHQISIYTSCLPAVACTVLRTQPLTLDDRPSTFRLGYRPELDGVRGISILLVLGLHFIPSLMPGGYLGVEIFFVLSGFLITSLLLQEWQRANSISLKDFYLRRALRLGPALVVYLLLLSAYAFVFMKRENATQIYTGVLWTLSYVSNWVLAFKPNYPVSVLAITWSLAVEEQFYLLWPLTLFVMLRNKVSNRWVVLVIACLLLLVALRRALLFGSGAPFHRLYYGTDTRADGLMLGCLLGCLVSWRLLPKSRVFEMCMKLLASLGVLFVSYLALTLKSSSPGLFRGVFSLATLAIAAMLTVVVVWPQSSLLIILKLPPLVWIGRISYGLYLWHWPVRGFVYGSQGHPTVLKVVVAVFLSFAVTSLSFYLIETPFLAWKKRLSHADEVLDKVGAKAEFVAPVSKAQLRPAR